MEIILSEGQIVYLEKETSLKIYEPVEHCVAFNCARVGGGGKGSR